MKIQSICNARGFQLAEYFHSKIQLNRIPQACYELTCNDNSDNRYAAPGDAHKNGVPMLNLLRVPLLVLFAFLLPLTDLSAAVPVFERLTIKGVTTLTALPLPVHHGLSIKIAPIADPNLRAFRLEVSDDNGLKWHLYDDAIRPYNTDNIVIPFRSSNYGLRALHPYRLKLCAIYGAGAESCAQSEFTIQQVAGSDVLDSDDDGLREITEYEWGVDPRNPDSDHDDMSDRIEVAYGLDPNLAQHPLLTLDSSSIDFGDGDSFGSRPNQHQSIVIRNTGDRPLRISNIMIRSEPEGVFIPSDEYHLISEISPNNAASFPVDFLPQGDWPMRATIDIISDDREHFPATIELTGRGIPTPVMEVRTEAPEINIGNVEVGDTVTSNTVTVRNVGDAPLNVTAYVDHALGFVVTPRHFTIVPTGWQNLTIKFMPDWRGSYDGRLTILGENDRALRTIKIPIRATVSGPVPKLRVDPLELRLSRGVSQANLQIYNDGDGILEVRRIDLGADERLLTGVGSNRVFSLSSRRLVVPPHSSRPVRVSLIYNGIKSYTSHLCIVSNDPTVGSTRDCGVARTVGDGITLPIEAMQVPLVGGGL